MQIEEIYKPVEGELAQVRQRLDDAASVHFQSLGDLLTHVLSAHGKMARPAVTLLAGKFHEDHPELLVPMGVSVEMLHLATLIHDDTVDNADVRRGKPTVNKAWGKDVAVLLGDYVFANAAVFVCSTNNVRVIDLFSKTLMALSSGELREMFTGRDWRQPKDNYWRRIEGKTASLFTTAAESGAILSGAPEDVISAFRAYGYNLGMAFQIVDDILDFEGDADEVGKPVGNDLLQGTLTLPSILLLEQYPNDNPVQKLFEAPGSKDHLEKALEMIRNSKVIQESYKTADEFCDKARHALDRLRDDVYHKSLLQLVDYTVARNK